MKTSSRFSLAMLGLAAILAPMHLAAQSSNFTITIPFDFTVASKALPAGEYRVSTRNGIVRVDSTDGDSHMAAVGFGVDDGNGEFKTSLVFKQYGDRYILSQIWGGTDHGTQLLKSAVERELMAKNQHGVAVTLLASR